MGHSLGWRFALALPHLMTLPYALAGPHRRQSVPPTLPGNWSSIGCYTDNAGARTLTGASTTDLVNMTVENCIGFCDSKKFVFAGVEFMVSSSVTCQRTGTDLASDARKQECCMCYTYPLISAANGNTQIVMTLSKTPPSLRPSPIATCLVRGIATNLAVARVD
ncbi:hypothetical protein FB451DRAFT_1136284 [Mycena latifolia]|nr:hypothetical protein FB451DRAFT_1136284 [Mycena latifolia]